MDTTPQPPTSQAPTSQAPTSQAPTSQAPTGQAPTDRPGGATGSGRHPVNIAHLVMGIAFLGLAVVWALVASDTVSGSDIRWLLPVPWVLAGLAGLLATTRSFRRSTEETS